MTDIQATAQQRLSTGNASHTASLLEAGGNDIFAGLFAVLDAMQAEGELPERPLAELGLAAPVPPAELADGQGDGLAIYPMNDSANATNFDAKLSDHLSVGDLAMADLSVAGAIAGSVSQENGPADRFLADGIPAQPIQAGSAEIGPSPERPASVSSALLLTHLQQADLVRINRKAHKLLAAETGPTSQLRALIQSIRQTLHARDLNATPQAGTRSLTGQDLPAPADGTRAVITQAGLQEDKASQILVQQAGQRLAGLPASADAAAEPGLAVRVSPGDQASVRQSPGTDQPAAQSEVAGTDDEAGLTPNKRQLAEAGQKEMTDRKDRADAKMASIAEAPAANRAESSHIQIMKAASQQGAIQPETESQPDMSRPAMPVRPGPDTSQQRLNMLARDWQDNLVRQAEKAMREGRETLQLVLTPKHLGRLQLSLGMQGDQTHIQIITETNAAAQMLGEAENRLQQMLESAGLRLASLNTSAGFGQHQQADSQKNKSTPDRKSAPAAAREDKGEKILAETGIKSNKDLLNILA